MYACGKRPPYWKQTNHMSWRSRLTTGGILYPEGDEETCIWINRNPIKSKAATIMFLGISL